MPSTPLTKVHHGRTRQIQPQVLLWRRRMCRYNALRARLMRFLLEDKGLPPTTVAEWFKTPSEALQGKTPKSLLNPTNIQRLYQHARREFRTK